MHLCIRGKVNYSSNRNYLVFFMILFSYACEHIYISPSMALNTTRRLGSTYQFSRKGTWVESTNCFFYFYLSSTYTRSRSYCVLVSSHNPKTSKMSNVSVNEGYSRDARLVYSVHSACRFVHAGIDGSPTWPWAGKAISNKETSSAITRSEQQCITGFHLFSSQAETRFSVFI